MLLKLYVIRSTLLYYNITIDYTYAIFLYYGLIVIEYFINLSPNLTSR